MTAVATRLFLSSMMGVTDGGFCARAGKGADLVQLGAYFAEPGAYGREGAVLPPGRASCIRFFRQEVEEARRAGEGVQVCLNLAATTKEDARRAADCFFEAGGDLVELNAHGGYGRYLEKGLLRAMALPENRNRLYEWCESLVEGGALWVKFRAGTADDFGAVLARLGELGVEAVHFNVRGEGLGTGFVRKARSWWKGKLSASGGVRTAADARAFFDAGADLVGVAEPCMKDSSFIARLADEFA